MAICHVTYIDMDRSSSVCQNTIKQTVSVWIDGDVVARDARDKLRASDEARSKKIALGTDGASSRLGTPLTRPSPSSPQGDGLYMSNLIGPQDQAADSSNTVYNSDNHEADGNATLPHSRPTLGKLQIPSSRFIAQPTISGENASGMVSPLMFVDSDISSSSSSSDQPTSATSTAATTSSSNHRSQTNSPSKRERSPSFGDSFSPLKKMRSMALPEIRTVLSHGTRLSLSMRAGIAGDNRQVIREATFTERAPAGVLPTSLNQHIPELSSFRPSIASPEGLEPVLAQISRPKSPMPYSERRSPSETPEPPETPSYARPLHLLDTSVVVGGKRQGDEWLQDISIFKNIHGEEWKRNALCSHCFRSRGTFNRIMTYGYEACGRDDPLDSHYWEPTANPNY
ncbi:hypothetical protein TUN199_07349 [Pyrenophora tritici-repentis]|nr:hypothetical protein Alg130_07329 [Pyrenophora tritici-repentis]KAI0608964.1 hypothetical protein TUN205_06792 [Pyrenophora tritici-repentis]KAI0620655.1 hypothetical protein TUN199_07349 [Pyrenophora tritici-repentis]